MTIRMILDSHESMQNTNEGPDGIFLANGREVSMFTLVAYLESKMEETEIFESLVLNDATGRIPAKVYRDRDQATCPAERAQAGEYVRVFGSLRTWNGQIQITCHSVRRVDKNSEVPFHLIEVVYTHLDLTGKL